MSDQPATFLERANKDVGTPKVAAVAAGARLLTTKRAAAVAAYPAMDIMRDRARAIRLHALTNLDRHLDQFADAVEAVGGRVFFAETAAEATTTSGASLPTRTRI